MSIKFILAAAVAIASPCFAGVVAPASDVRSSALEAQAAAMPAFDAAVLDAGPESVRGRISTPWQPPAKKDARCRCHI